MPIAYLCDECGKPGSFFGGMTGRVLIDDVDNNQQSVILCEDHAPLEGAYQPNNCVHVKFYWPGSPELNV